MNERKYGRRGLNHHDRGRKGISSIAAGVVLVVAVGIVGAVGYVVLSTIGIQSTSTGTTSSCSPSTAPQCGGDAKTNDMSSHELIAAGLVS
jgi:hypothetical protein